MGYSNWIYYHKLHTLQVLYRGKTETVNFFRLHHRVILVLQTARCNIDLFITFFYAKCVTCQICVKDFVRFSLFPLYPMFKMVFWFNWIGNLGVGYYKFNLYTIHDHLIIYLLQHPPPFNYIFIATSATLYLYIYCKIHDPLIIYLLQHPRPSNYIFIATSTTL